MRFPWIAILLVVGVLSTYSQQEVPKDLAITLERSMCFGWCPAYTLTITADGSVKFTPTGGFAHRGDGPVPRFPLSGKVNADKLRELLAEFENIKFFSLQKHYGRVGMRDVNSTCPHSASDSASAEITFVRNGKRKSVDHYLGCNGTKTLDDLVTLENKIDQIANVDQWTSQFGWGTGSVVDLKLKVNRSSSSKPEKQ